MKKNLILQLTVATLTVASVANAATLAYWRFGDDTSYTYDSTGNGHNITGITATQTTLPGSGDGSAFPDPIPQTGQSNANAADFNGTNSGDRAIADDFFDSSSDFTVETLFNMSAVNNSREQYILSQYNTSSNRSWAIGVADGDEGINGSDPSELFLYLSSDGEFGTSTTVGLGLTVAANTDYYISVGFDNTSSTNDLSFYYQDLTNGGALQSATFSSGITALHDSTAQMEFGAFATDNSNFGGLIDEVRISDSVLEQSDLLMVPEPTTMASMLMALGLFASSGFIRKRRAAKRG